MPICSMCGKEFSVSDARRTVGEHYGYSSYLDYFPDKDVCGECALEDLGSALPTADEIDELNDITSD